MRRRALPLAVVLALGLSGCRTPSVDWVPVGAGDPRPAALQAGLMALAQGRQGLRAQGRVRTEGEGTGGFGKHLLLVERPAQLRVEVIGPLAQRVLVLATDGTHYALYRAREGGIERGDVHPGVLAEAAGLPLTPDAAAGLLLAAPLPPPDPPAGSFAASDGGVSLRWPDQTLDFDAAGRLATLTFHPGGQTTLVARWSEWREAADGAFPHRLELSVSAPETSWRLDYEQVELDPVLAPELFTLPGGAE